MSTTVLEIRDMLSPDSLARNIYTQYNLWYTQTSKKRALDLELRNYLFATDTRTTSAGAAGWNNSTTIPKLTQIRDNLHANYMSALFPSSNWLIWEAHSQDAATLAKRTAIQGYMRNKLNISDFKETVSQLLYDFIDYGNAIADVEYVNETNVLEGSGEEVAGYIGPRLVRVSPNDIQINPTATRFADTPKVTRYVMSIGELMQEIEDNPDMGYVEGIIEELKTTRGKISGFAMEDVEKSEAINIDGFGSLTEYYQSGYVEIIEFEGSIYDPDADILLKNHIVSVFDRRIVGRKQQHPSWTGKSLKELVGWRDRPDNLWAMGPLHNLVGLQYRLDHLENLKADALDLNIHSPLVIKGDVDPFVYAPKTQIHIPDGDGDVTRIPPDPAAFQVNNEIGYLLQIMEEMAGAPKEAMGIRSPGEKTAFEVDKLATAATRIFQQKIDKFERFLEKLINNMLQVSKRNLDGEDIAKVIDDDIGVESFIKITKEDITSEGKLVPVGAKHFAAQARAKQNLTVLVQSGILQLIMPHVSKKALAAMSEELLDLERYDVIRNFVGIMEDAETQKIVNSASENIEVDQATPGVEGADEDIEQVV